MFGDLGLKLVYEAKRTSNLKEIAKFQGELINEIVDEINELEQKTEKIQQQKLTTKEETQLETLSFFIAHLAMRRNKRCLLAYENVRAKKIIEFVWLNVELGKTAFMRRNEELYDGYTTQIEMDSISPSEQRYFIEYQKLVNELAMEYENIDFFGDLSPPTDIFVDVRVLRDAGEIQTEFGCFNLRKNTQLYVRRSDVERLIQQGYLEPI